MSAPAVTWCDALRWRARRHGLEADRDESVAQVVDAVGAVVAHPTPTAEAAVGVRRRGHRPGDVAAALASGEVLKVFAFRGATHLLTPQAAADVLALRASSRMWELPSWRAYYRLEPEDWPAFRAAVRTALADGPLTTRQLADAVARDPAYRHAAELLVDGSGTLLKPLVWQGDMCFAPSADGRTRFQRLDSHPRWPGLPDLDVAGPRAVEAYVRAFGPATAAGLRYWYGEGLGAGRHLRRWTAALGGRLTTVDVDGEPALVATQDVDALVGTAPGPAVVALLPGYDPWVLGPGTRDEHVVPAALRAQVTRGADVVVVDGVVRGTWRRDGDDVRVAWLGSTDPAHVHDADGPVPAEATAAALARLGVALGRTLRLRQDG